MPKANSDAPSHSWFPSGSFPVQSLSYDTDKSRSKCYTMKWSTDGVLSHTTAEVRDAGSNEVVFFRDTDGDWTAEKNEVSYPLLMSIMVNV